MQIVIFIKIYNQCRSNDFVMGEFGLYFYVQFIFIINICQKHIILSIEKSSWGGSILLTVHNYYGVS